MFVFLNLVKIIYKLLHQDINVLAVVVLFRITLTRFLRKENYVILPFVPFIVLIRRKMTDYVYKNVI